MTRRRGSLRRLAIAIVVSAVAPGVLHAQEATRADEIAAAQAAKAKEIQPYEPNRFEQFGANLRKQMTESPDGPHIWMDSVYSGGGFTLGGGYRRFIGDRAMWDGRGLLSVRGYTRLEFDVVSPGLADDKIDVRGLVGWRNATQVSFYGVGADTSPDGRTNFQLQQTYIGGDLRVRGPAATVMDAALYYEDFSLDSGKGSSPSIEDVHTPATAPGLGDNPAFLHLKWRGAFDTRPAEDYARRGGLYGVTYDLYLDKDDTYTFDLLQGEVVQHFPVLRETWVLSLHGVVRTTLDDEDTVPYFLMPALGSGSTLRAFSSWRFRDRHSILFSGEWRWIPNRMFVDMALFADAGKVASHRSDLDFSDLTTDYGVGIRFHSPRRTPLRIDVAHGSEGFNIVFSGGAAF